MLNFSIHKSILLILFYSFFVTGSVFAQCPVSVTVSSPSFGQGEIQLIPNIIATSYQWQRDGFDIPGGVTRIYPVHQSGTYTVKITNYAGCTSVSNQVPVTITNNRTYVVTNEIYKPGVTENEQVNALGPNDLSQNVSYLDGLGRSVQEVTTWGSTGNDMVSFTKYDHVGRVPTAYLPAPIGINGEFITDPIPANSSFYFTLKGDNTAYADKIFDGSPLNRVTEQTAPGNNYYLGSGHTLKTKYGKNNSGEIRLWNYDPANGSVTGASFYNANELYLTQQINEHGQGITLYKDKNGLLICKIVQPVPADPNTWLYNYYVYDDLGNIRYTITPEGYKELAASNYTFGYNDNVCKKWFYANNYDERNRLTIKRGPGADEEYIVYDSRDRMVFAQTANQRNNNNQWMATLYDVFDRPVITGLVNISGSLSQVQNAVNLQTADVVNDPQITTIDGIAVYKNPLPAGAPFEQVSATFYDDYSWVAGRGTGFTGTMDQTYTNSSYYFPVDPLNYAQQVKANYHVKGKATGAKMRVLGTNQFLYTITFYDTENHTIQIQSTNQTGGRDVLTYQYHFNGKLIRTLNQYVTTGTGGKNFRVGTKFEYNRLGLLTSVKKRINLESERLIATYVYNELGELKSKSFANDLEVLNYEYNLRGWLTSVNKDYLQTPVNSPSNHWFGMELAYDKTSSVVSNTSYSNPQYNGNLSGTLWKTRGSGVNRKFEYTYDKIDRLTGAGFKQQFGAVWSNTDPNNPNFTIDYAVGGKGSNNQYIEYDDNGNIKNCWRKGLKLNASPVIDDLTYGNYTGNQLGTVADVQTDPNPGLGDFHDGANTGNDYAYDGNGNLTKDENKKITSIAYNYLNLPEVITFSNSNGTTNTITYTYDAGGTKLQKVIVDNNTPGKTITVTSKYINGCVYESRATTNRTTQDPPDYTNKLLYVPHEEGRLRFAPDRFNPMGFVTDFYITDNLGNVRMILTDDHAAPNKYPMASMEDVVDKTNLNDATNYIPYYGNVDYTTNAGVRTVISSIPGYPTTGDVNATTPNNYVAQLNGNGNKVGPSIVLKVMAGDQFNVRVSSWYNSNGASPDLPVNPLNDLVGILANGIGGLPGSKVSAGDLQTSNVLGPNIFEFLNGKTVEANRPKAYLNWVFFDEQFHFVQSGSSFQQVPDESEFLNNTSAPIVKWLGTNGVTAERNGYLYVYVSNETPNINVYFDNLQVTHTPGALLEENHYYPMGMTMAGISSRALNGLSVNRRKFQGQEFEDALGLNMYEFELRQYDPQLGRWVVRDPENQFASPYQAMANNWPNGTDPNGAYFGVDDIIVTAAGFAVGYLISGLESNNWGWQSVKSGLITAAMFEIGYLTGGSAALAETQAVLTGGTAASYATMGAYIASSVATTAVAQFMPAIPIGDNFSISPAVVFGSQGITAGATVNYHSGNFSMGFGFTGGADGPRISYGGGWDDGKTGFSYYRSNYYRSFKQASGQLGMHFGPVSIRADEDIIGDGHDRYRTGAVRVGYRLQNGDEISAGFRVRTGEYVNADTEKDPRAKHGPKLQYKNEFNIQREGLLYGGYTRNGLGINAGINSEGVRYGIQNGLHDALRWSHLTHDQHFKYIPDIPRRAYFEVGRFYPFALY